MYAIIYWACGNNVYALRNKDKTLRLFLTIEEADAKAEQMEEDGDNLEARVISIQGVCE